MKLLPNIFKPRAERVEKDARDLIFSLLSVSRDLVYIDAWLPNRHVLHLPEYPQVKIVTNERALHQRRTGNGWHAVDVELANTPVSYPPTPEQAVLIHQHRAAIKHALGELQATLDTQRAAVSAEYAQRRKAKAQADRYERQSRLNQIKAGLAK